jgi:hypothetical protein
MGSLQVGQDYRSWQHFAQRPAIAVMQHFGSLGAMVISQKATARINREEAMISKTQAGVLVTALAALLGASPAFAQQPIEMKIAYFVGDQHAMSQ